MNTTSFDHVRETESVETMSGETSCAVKLTQTLLWVHQQQWQRELLTRYGNHISLIDATYRTMKYELPLFFVCACTHQCGIQCCSTVHRAISKYGMYFRGIECPKEWNSNWNPPFFFCDFSDAEFSEVQQSYVLPNLKATEWYRWYNDFVPRILRGIPRSVILHCLDRQSQSNKYHDEDLMDGEKEGALIIQRKDGAQYMVNFGRNSQEQMPSCSCKDWTRWHIPCKHFVAVFRLRQAWC